ncbi:MAG: DUF2071 domain-containing protein [Bacteroidota bacterium]
MSFLKAEWRKLILINYAVDAALLHPFVPNGTELDRWNDTVYVSLVGFMFVNTRLLGIKIPFHTNFEEVNLRFYVRYKSEGQWKRGVVFIKEIVPKSALTLVANTLYKEHYETMPMSHQWTIDEQFVEVAYKWRCQGAWQEMWAKGKAMGQAVVEGSEEEFIMEHYWGYTKVDEQITYEYEVTHPQWQFYPVSEHRIDVDYRRVYGDRFSGLQQLSPKSIILAEGSVITVEGKRRIA